MARDAEHALQLGAASLDLRTRYIGAMGNRAAAQYPGEAFTSPDAITYWDAGAGYQLTSKLLVRAGINNVLDQSPPVYAPNIHAGTDPSLYDVVGRILLAQIRISI